MSFTIDFIKAAHSKVKTGADFPVYIREIRELGVVRYQTDVATGATTYFDKDGNTALSGAKYETLVVSDEANTSQFVNRLKAHQQGKTDYKTFCKDCAENGVDHWVMSIENMTCTYFDKAGNELLVETVPG